MAVQAAVMINFPIFHPKFDPNPEKIKRWATDTYINDPSPLIKAGDLMVRDPETRKYVRANLSPKELIAVFKNDEFGDYYSQYVQDQFLKAMKYPEFNDEGIRGFTDMMDGHLLGVNVRYTVVDQQKYQATVRAVIGPFPIDHMSMVFNGIVEILGEKDVGTVNGSEIFLSFKSTEPFDISSIAEKLGISYNGQKKFSDGTFDFVVDNDKHLHLAGKSQYWVDEDFYSTVVHPIISLLLNKADDSASDHTDIGWQNAGLKSFSQFLNDIRRDEAVKVVKTPSDPFAVHGGDISFITDAMTFDGNPSLRTMNLIHAVVSSGIFSTDNLRKLREYSRSKGYYWLSSMIPKV